LSFPSEIFILKRAGDTIWSLFDSNWQLLPYFQIMTAIIISTKLEAEFGEKTKHLDFY